MLVVMGAITRTIKTSKAEKNQPSVRLNLRILRVLTMPLSNQTENTGISTYSMTVVRNHMQHIFHRNALNG